MSNYYCPNCQADLEEQDGFDPEDGYWTCAECVSSRAFEQKEHQ